MSEEKFMPQTEIRAELTLTKEDLVRIKYAEEEDRLHKKQKALNKDKKKESEAQRKAEKAFEKILGAGTDETPAEYADLAAALETLGNETKGGSARSLIKVKEEQEIKLSNGAVLEGQEDGKGPYYISERRMLAWRPPLNEEAHQRPDYIEAYHDTVRRSLSDEEQRALDVVLEQEERVEALNKELLKVKEAISELPLMQRQAEAAIARKVLEATAAGQQMIEALGSVDVPMLEEAKEDAGAE
jgi:hypothetical protein